MAGDRFPVDLGEAPGTAGRAGGWDIMTRFYQGAQAETKQEAGHSGQHWADDELAIITRPDLSIKEAALMLGRTYASVARRRHLLRRHQHLTQGTDDRVVPALVSGAGAG